jgi:hypothetical protein
VIASGRSVEVLFESDFMVQGLGFRAEWSVEHERPLICTPPCKCARLTVGREAHGKVEDGSGDGDYMNNMRCSWMIEGAGGAPVVLRFTFVDTEWDYDVVSVYSCEDATCIRWFGQGVRGLGFVVWGLGFGI